MLVETIDQVNFEIDHNINWEMKETETSYTWSPGLSKIIMEILSKWEEDEHTLDMEENLPDFLIKKRKQIKYLKNGIDTINQKIEMFIENSIFNHDQKRANDYIDDEYRENIKYIYWNKLLSYKKIIETSKLTPQQLNIILEKEIEIDCSQCDKYAVVFKVKNHQTFDKIKKHPVLCNKCREIQNLKSIEQNQQQKIQIKKIQEDLQKLKTIPYQEYLETDHWKYIRKLALRRAQYKCSLCGKDKIQLHVHHNSYEHRGEEQNHLENIIVICSECHAKFHDKPVQNNKEN